MHVRSCQTLSNLVIYCSQRLAFVAVSLYKGCLKIYAYRYLLNKFRSCQEAKWIFVFVKEDSRTVQPFLEVTSRA